MAPWVCTTCGLDQYLVIGNNVMCSVCSSSQSVDKSVEILTISPSKSGESDSSEDELNRQTSVNKQRVPLRGAAKKSKKAKLERENLDTNDNNLKSRGSSIYIDNVQTRQKRAGRLRSQIESRVNNLNRQCGFSALVILRSPQPKSGPRAKGLEMSLKDKNGISPPTVCNGDCGTSGGGTRTVNRGAQFYFGVKNSQDPTLTPTDTRTRLAREVEGENILSPTGGDDQDSSSLDLSFDNDTTIATHSMHTLFPPAEEQNIPEDVEEGFHLIQQQENTPSPTSLISLVSVPVTTHPLIKIITQATSSTITTNTVADPPPTKIATSVIPLSPVSIPSSSPPPNNTEAVTVVRALQPPPNVVTTIMSVSLPCSSLPTSVASTLVSSVLKLPNKVATSATTLMPPVSLPISSLATKTVSVKVAKAVQPLTVQTPVTISTSSLPTAAAGVMHPPTKIATPLMSPFSLLTSSSTPVIPKFSSSKLKGWSFTFI